MPFNGGVGGTALRLPANDAAACQTTTVSPGLTNDWPKWSPQAVTANGKTYYWLTFSSKRTGTGNAQLYITAVVVDEVGQITHLSGALSVESAVERRQPHAVLGRLRHRPDQHRLTDRAPQPAGDRPADQNPRPWGPRP